jgi:Tfp pilus assembly protein PilV
MQTAASEMLRISVNRQRGTTLLEALIAFLVLALGMLTVARMQTQMRLGADIARQRSEAVRIAQEDLESLRSFASFDGIDSYAGIRSGSRTIDPPAGRASDTRYLLTRQVSVSDGLRAKDASVTVEWTDRRGGRQKVALQSIIAGIDPALSGALTLARTGASPRGAMGRSARILLDSKNLGDGTSVFKPAAGGTIAWIFDNATGRLIGSCKAPSNNATSNLSRADLAQCDSNVGYLLSGIVRFSSSSPPDAARANEPPVPATMALSLSGGHYPVPSTCFVASTAASAVDRYLAYHCAVYPAANDKWSGRLTVRPVGWTIGTASTDRRVCRFISDLDGSGAIDENIEHPAAYTDVDTALMNQNFLVIAGAQSCPPGGPAHTSALSTPGVDPATAQQQP